MWHTDTLPRRSNMGQLGTSNSSCNEAKEREKKQSLWGMFFIGFLPKCPHFYGEPAANPIRKDAALAFYRPLTPARLQHLWPNLYAEVVGRVCRKGGLIEAVGCWGGGAHCILCSAVETTARGGKLQRREGSSREKMTAFLKCVWGLVWSKGDRSGQPLNSAVIRDELQLLHLPEPFILEPTRQLNNLECKTLCLLNRKTRFWSPPPSYCQYSDYNIGWRWLNRTNCYFLI